MKKLRHLPLFKLAICFLAGIVLARHYGMATVWVCAPALPLYLVCLIRDRRTVSWRFEWLIALSIFMCITGAGAASYLVATYTPGIGLAPINCEQVQVVGVIASEVKENAYGRNAQVALAGYMQEDSLKALPGKVLMYFDTTQTAPLQLHDSIFATVYITDLSSRYPGYLTYLRQQGVSHSAYCKALVAGGPRISFRYHFDRLRQELSARMALLIPDAEIAGIAQAMLLGDKSELQQETREAFGAAGVSHILAISGLHVGIIYLMLNALMQVLHLLRHGRRLKYLLMLVLLIVYMLITGASPAVVRAVVMFGTILVFKIGYQRYHILNVVASSALIQMVWNPEIVFNAGFQLSYAAVTGILVLYPIFERAANSPYPLLNKLYGWIGVTIAAQISTLPLILIHFGQFPAYFLLANVCLVLLTSAAVLVGFATVLLIWVPGLNAALGFVSYLLLATMAAFCKWIAALPHAVITDFSWQDKGLHIVAIQLLIVGILLVLPRIPLRKLTRRNAKPALPQQAITA